MYGIPRVCGARPDAYAAVWHVRHRVVANVEADVVAGLLTMFAMHTVSTVVPATNSDRMGCSMLN